MRLIDTSAINFILENNTKLTESYYVTPDIKGEAEVAELVIGRRLPSEIKDLASSSLFNEVIYVDRYKYMLNKHKGKSFYKMSGFGDISILAALGVLRYTIQMRPKELFHNPNYDLSVVTTDGGLIKRINREFNYSEKDPTLKIDIFNNDIFV